MDWRLFIWVSEWLNPGAYSDTEYFKLGRSRSGISRAYYAAHNVARLYVHNKKYSTSWPHHEALWSILEARANTDERLAGVLGQELRVDRNEADYDAPGSARNFIEKHRIALEKAYRICKLLGEPCPPPPPKTAKSTLVTQSPPASQPPKK